MTTDQMRTALAEAGQRRSTATAELDEAMAAIAKLVKSKAARDLDVAEVARLAGITRQTVYNLRK